MGPPDLRTLVARQTDQITILTSQLEASLAHNVRLNTRLSTALDTLDVLHAELDTERRKNDRYLWMGLVQELQREKDEMKEVVELLIRKVERSGGNFDKWPTSKMYLPSPAGRSTRFIDSRLPPVTPPRAEAFLHALALERGRCRQTSEALKDAHETILTLEAQVARREAELESRDHQHIASVKPVPQKRSLVETLCAKVPDVSLSEVIHSLSMAEENNHVLEREVSELSNHRPMDDYQLRSTSVGVQTSPLRSEALRLSQCSLSTTPTRTRSRPRGAPNGIEDLKARVELLADAINDFEKERQFTKNTFGSMKELADTRSTTPPASSPSTSNDYGVLPIPHFPQLPPRKPISPESPSHKPQPDFQHILRIEHECLRLTRINERLERELSELRAVISPVSRASSISFFRSPAPRTPALPTVSPSGFSVRSSGERDMDISFTPLHFPSTLPDEDRDHNRLPDPNNTSMNPEPPGDNTMNPSSPEVDSKDRPSSAPPDIDDNHLSVLLSPFQLSASLPPRSKSTEPPSRSREQRPET